MGAAPATEVAALVSCLDQCHQEVVVLPGGKKTKVMLLRHHTWKTKD